MANNGTVKKVAVGAAVAGTIGFLVGILFAPKSGKETRADLKEGALKAKTEIEKKLKTAHTDLNVLITEVKKISATASKKMQKEIEVLLAEAKKAQKHVKDILSAIHEGEVNDPDLKAALQEANAAKDHLAKFLSK